MNTIASRARVFSSSPISAVRVIRTAAASLWRVVRIARLTVVRVRARLPRFATWEDLASDYPEYSSHQADKARLESARRVLPAHLLFKS